MKDFIKLDCRRGGFFPWGRRRRGFLLVTALVIALIGAFLAAHIFVLAEGMHGTDMLNQRTYQDQIDVASIMEQVKGLIVQENITRSDDLSSSASAGVVLHGQGATASHDYFPIHSLDDLRVTALAELSRDIPMKPDYRGNRYVARLCVYDTNYRIEDVKFTPDADFPPSLCPPLRFRDADPNEIVEEGSAPIGPGGGGGSAENDAIPLNYYKELGAYLVRVDLYREGGDRPIRRMEEMFYMLIPER